MAVHDWPVDIAPTLNAAFGSKQGLEDQHIRGGADCSFPQVAMCLNAGAMGRRDAETETLIPTHGGGFDVETLHGGDIARTLSARHDGSPCDDRGPNVVSVKGPLHQATHEVAGTMMSYAKSGGDSNRIDNAAAGYMALTGSAVRRLTPRECERLQGFPDDYTLAPYRNKPAADGPRYKALGNSMAVPVMSWIGQRIAAVEALLNERIAA